MRLDELKAIQNDFLSAVLQTQEDGSIPQSEGLGIYSRMSESFDKSVLESIFPATKILVGDTDWADLNSQFHKHSGFDHFNVNKGVTPFLTLLSNVGVPQHIFELAEYEYLQLEIAESNIAEGIQLLLMRSLIA